MNDNKQRLERIEADLTEVIVILHKFNQTSKQQASALGTLQDTQERIKESQERTQIMVERHAENQLILDVKLDRLADDIKDLSAVVRGIAQGRTNGKKGK
jgi:hypothetical protein